MREDIKDRIEQVKCGKTPKGYANTRIGFVPCEWRLEKLKKYIIIYEEKATENNQYPILTSSRKGLLLQSDYYKGQVTTDDNMGYNVIPRGFITYRSRSDDGLFVFNENKVVDKGIISYFYPVFCFSSQIEHDFILRLMNFTSYRQAYAFVEGTAQQVLSIKKLSNLKYYIPSLVEQQKIATILAQCDKIIELKKHLIEEERKRKKWLMQKLFNPDNGVRINGFTGKWLTRTLGTVGVFSKGAAISNNDCSSGDCPCIKYGDIYMSLRECFSCPVSYTKEKVAKVSPKVNNGVLLFTASGEDRMEIGKCTAYLGVEPLAVGGDIVICTPDPTLYDPKFLAYQQYTEKLIKQKSVLAQGYSIVHLYGEQIKKLHIFMPPTKEEQVAISNLVSCADNIISSLDDELSQWQQKKKALMQLLLTGLVRV